MTSNEACGETAPLPDDEGAARLDARGDDYRLRGGSVTCLLRQGHKGPHRGIYGRDQYLVEFEREAT